MRWLAGLLAIVTCVGAAMAQSRDAPVDDRFIAEWEELAGVTNSYPPDALYLGRSGFVELCCTANSDRTVACRVGFETPEGNGFGEFALRLSRRMRMTPESYAAFQADPSNWLQLSLHWTTGGARRMKERVRVQTANLCRLSDAASGPAPLTPEAQATPQN